MSERQGIEIDYCPQCRGVWLDRGELDKLIERSMAHELQRPPVAPMAPTAPQRQSRPDFVDSDFDKSRGHGQYRKKSWLNDLFD